MTDRENEPLPAASLEVDAEADAWYVRILDEDVHHTTESAPVNLDWTRDGRLVGVELLGPLRRGASERAESAGRCVAWLYSERDDKVYWPDPMIIDLWHPYAPTHDEIHESDLPDDVEPLLPPAAVSAGMHDAEATIRELTAAVAGKDGYIGMLRRQRDDAESASRLAQALSALRLRDVDRLRAERDEARQRAASWWEAAKTLNRWGTVHRKLQQEQGARADAAEAKLAKEKAASTSLYASVFRALGIDITDRAGWAGLPAAAERIRRERDEARAKLDTVRKVLDEPDFRHPKHLLDFDTSGELGDCLDDCPGCAVDAIRRIVVGEVQR